MKIVLLTMGIVVVVTATPIGKIEEELLNNNIEIPMSNLENDESLQVTKTKSNIVAKPDADKVIDLIPEDEKSLKIPLKYNINITEAKKLNDGAIFKKLSGLAKSLNASIQDSKFNECVYEGAKAFVICELHVASEMEDVVDFFPFIKCASTAAVAFANCFFHKSGLLHPLREDIGANKDTKAIYKTLQDTIMKMFVAFDNIDAQKVIGTDYYSEHEDTTPEVNE